MSAGRVIVLLAVAACGDTTRMPHGDDVVDATHVVDAVYTCGPTQQVGCASNEKCTWILEGMTPGHIGCVPTGTVPLGQPCHELAGGYDDCVAGALCGIRTQTAAVCQAICDGWGGDPMCGSGLACATFPDVFDTDPPNAPIAGVCANLCDPLADNDFDGAGSAFMRSGSGCGSATIGCYGLPSIYPPSAFVCMQDAHYASKLRNRSQCTAATGCLFDNAVIAANSCNQGYEPLTHASTGVTTTFCAALCAPLDCYAGNCGSNDANRVGAAPHRCASTDAAGTFGSGDECRYWWLDEIDGSGRWHPSAYSNTLGICVDGDGLGQVRCETLSLAQATQMGCVSTTTGGIQP